MSRDEVTEFLKGFDLLVNNEYKVLLFNALKRYREQPTKKKLLHIIMNLPVGAIIRSSDFPLSDRPPDYETLIKILIDNVQIRSIIKEL